MDGNIHPHPNPLPSRERETARMIFPQARETERRENV
jgi:hypothetical protein